MAQRLYKGPGGSLTPTLLSPLQETVVDGRDVTFAWEPLPEGVSVEIEVASDFHFDHLVLEQDVTGRTSLTVYDLFPTSGETYYWRIIVDDGQGLLHGEDSVEAFVAGTADEAAAHHSEITGGGEKYGPIGELMKGAGAEMAAEMTRDEEYFRREVELGVAHEGIAAGQIFAITAAIILALVLIVVTLIQYTRLTTQEVRYSAVGMSGYPERRQAEVESARLLGEYGVVDRGQGVYRIPIERAMELMANEAQQQQNRAYSPELPLRQADRSER